MTRLADYDGAVWATWPHLPENDNWNEERKLELYVQHTNFVRDMMLAGGAVLAVITLAACWWVGVWS